MVLQIGQELRAILFTLLCCENIFVSKSGKPCIRSNLAHLFSQDPVRNLRMPREAHAYDRQTWPVLNLEFHPYPLAGQLFFDREHLRLWVSHCRESRLDRHRDSMHFDRARGCSCLKRELPVLEQLLYLLLRKNLRAAVSHGRQ